MGMIDGKIHILFVCLGNICRSPMAEALFKHHIKEQSLVQFFSIDSAGTGSYHEGKNYHSSTIRVVQENGIEIDGHSRPVQAKDFTNFDYILAMDESNYDNLETMAAENPQVKAKINHILAYSTESHRHGLSVPDPYFSGYNGFQSVFDLLNDACLGFLQALIQEHKLLDGLDRPSK